MIPDPTTVGLFLYDVVTNTDAAGNVTEKQNFEWYFSYRGQLVEKEFEVRRPERVWVTQQEWQTSADAFPIEYEDMREAHRVLAGRDPWAGITVQRDHVRRQLEHELVGKLVRLRQAYAALGRDRRAEPVFEKHVGNFCEYFELVRRVFVPPAEEKTRESAARDQLKKLLGD